MPPKVLVVDDSAFMRKVLTGIIESMEWKVVGEAASGEEAVALCGKLKPDLVTMDIVMSGMGGIEATVKIKRINPKIKVLPITALGTQSRIMDEVIAAGGETTYITKPFKDEAVKEALSDVFS